MKSMTDMEERQRRLQAALGGKPGILGIGIGANTAETDLAFRVYVDTGKTAANLPDMFEGVEVVKDVVGEIKAY